MGNRHQESAREADFRGSLEEQIFTNQFQPLPVLISHAVAAAALPLHHRDPFDRMLIAQARLESLTLLTSDARLKLYDASVLLV